jgi:uncharacterized membrane protein
MLPAGTITWMHPLDASLLHPPPHSPPPRRAYSATADKELIVVTIIVAADGGFKLPQVDSRGSLKQALAMLGAIRADDLLAVEVLWTPEEEDDHFSVEDLAVDYPLLNTL